MKNHQILVTLIVALTLASANACGAQAYRYAATANAYAHNGNWTAAVKSEFGADATVADWNQILQDFGGSSASLIQFMNTAGLTQYRSHAWVTRNGNQFYASARSYFVERHDGSVPQGWLVHASLFSYTLDLGSWNNSRLILARIPISDLQPPKAAAAWEGTDDFSSGISTNNWTFYHNNSGKVRALAANGHVTFIVPEILADDTSEALIWHGNPKASEDWNVEVTGRVSAPSSRLQLYAFRTDTLLSTYYYVEMYRKAGRGFIVGLTGTRRVIVDATNTLFSLRLRFRSSVGRIEAWCDPDATGLGWTMLDAISLADFSPTMATSNTFTFGVNVIAPELLGPIAEGQLWADDFRLTAVSPPPPPLVATVATGSALNLILNAVAHKY